MTWELPPDEIQPVHGWWGSRRGTLGLYEGLRLAWDKGLRRILVESDSKDTITLLIKREASRGVSSLIPRVHEFLQRDWSISLRHVPRECNRVVDTLAHLAWTLPHEYVVFHGPPEECNAAFHDDTLTAAM
ncbi:uncharacterized protein LOC120125286 [Hibiscus syriacus]|uniref:uncharacterized protein LOC120125286 n=1 Tax=Hibiscus syriacus TaxID=106335 RepID=UPI00192472D2|nr:uncharacterized protein LOC120125286 [Hibiscus syriacus]